MKTTLNPATASSNRITIGQVVSSANIVTVQPVETPFGSLGEFVYYDDNDNVFYDDNTSKVEYEQAN